MKRIAVCSDIHGNLPAFEAVLEDMGERGVEACWYLGDIVVYGPNPCECIDLFRDVSNRWPTVIVRGNNDHAVIKDLQNRNESRDSGGDLLARAGIVDLQDPHQAERRSYVIATELSHTWTVEKLKPEHQDWLIGMPSGTRLPREDVLLVHASPCEPVGEEGSYLHDTPDAEEAWLSLDQPICFFGHTHVGVAFRKVRSRPYHNTEKIVRPTDSLPVDDRPLMVNPGSVGQPRDGIPMASYAIYDQEEKRVEFYRVPYDVEATVQALEAMVEELEGLIPQLNAQANMDPPPYEFRDAATTISLLSRRLKEAQ